MGRIGVYDRWFNVVSKEKGKKDIKGSRICIRLLWMFNVDFMLILFYVYRLICIFYEF